MNINERIKLLRKDLGLTQQEFADKLGIKRGAIANYEIGRNSPLDAVLTLICNIFNVNKEWLVNGMGEMYTKVDTFSLDDFARQHGATSDEIEFLKYYFELDENIRHALLNHFKNKYSTPYDRAPKTSKEMEEKFKPVNIADNHVG